MTETSHDMASDHGEAAHKASDVLLELAESFPNERVSVGELVDGLKDRAFGMLMLVLALPCCLPFLYGIPQVVSVPMIFVAAQIVMGRHTLWLPEKVRARSFSRDSFRDMAARAKRYVGWAEALARPRLRWLTRGPFERFFGLLMLIFSLSIAVPLPMTNTTPGIAVAIMSVAFMEEDGLLMVAGAVLGVLWVSFLIAVAVALLVFGIDLVSMIRGG